MAERLRMLVLEEGPGLGDVGERAGVTPLAAAPSSLLPAPEQQDRARAPLPTRGLRSRAPQAGAAVEGICKASARPCPWPGGLRLLSRSSRHVWPGLWRPHGDLIRLPACAEFMVKCSALGRGTERGSLESRHASPLRPREPARPGPRLRRGCVVFPSASASGKG